jgi:hypothetical protein
MNRHEDLESVLYDTLAHAKRRGVPSNAIVYVQMAFVYHIKQYSHVERAPPYEPGGVRNPAFASYCARRNSYAARKTQPEIEDIVKRYRRDK